MLTTALLACAAAIAPATLEAVVQVESRGNPLALHVNHWTGPQPTASSIPEAVEQVRKFVAMGLNVDIGLGQINSRNLDRFGVKLEDAFQPCQNLALSGIILSGFYGQAVQKYGEGQQALKAALSGYNTGNLSNGFANGYVGKYFIGPKLAPVVTSPAVIAETQAVKPWTTVAYDRDGYAFNDIFNNPSAVLEVK
jgi:type IV secretion system protein VirB1